MPRPRFRDRYAVHELPQFRALIARLGTAHGSGVKAAKAIGISQPAFSRLKHIKAGDTITHDVMAKLARSLGVLASNLTHQLAATVMGTAGKRLWQQIYLPWCQERASRFSRRRGATWLRTLGSPEEHPTLERSDRNHASANRAYLMRMTLRLMERDCPDAWSQGLRRLKESGSSAARVNVALARMAEPLAEFADSGYVERRWGELSKAEKPRYLAHAFALELLLLDRPNDQERARSVAETHRIVW
jgi:hypothetical protein